MRIVGIPHIWPSGAAFGQKVLSAMNVILHIGAHRCATTSFQHYLRHNTSRLQDQGIGFWGPWRTRNGLFSGVLPGGPVGPGVRDAHKRAAGRIRLACARSHAAGTGTLLVSDENIMGSVRNNIRLGDLYCGVGERVARFAEAFGDHLTDIVVNIRSQDHYWASALGYTVARGRALPGSAALAGLARSARGWRDVVTDVAVSAGGKRVWVLPFETFAGQPEAQLAVLTGAVPPLAEARTWLNRTPPLEQLRAEADPDVSARLPGGEGRWSPFAPGDAAALRETYADDMMWLTGGADGCARLVTGRDIPRRGLNRPGSDLTRGRTDDDQDRRVAQAR